MWIAGIGFREIELVEVKPLAWANEQELRQPRN